MKLKANININNIIGVMIILFVLSSFLNIFNLNKNILIILKMLNCFCIPILVFMSGYLFKNAKKNECLILLLNYIIGNSALMLYGFIISGQSYNLIIPYYSFWFLLSLFFWVVIIHFFGNVKGIFIFSLIISLLIGFFDEINSIFALSYTISFFPFFVLGYKIKDKISDTIECKKNIKTIIIGFICLIIGFLILYKFIFNFTLEDTLMLPYINNRALINRGIIIIASLFFISASLLLTPTKKIIFVTKCGENFLPIICYHNILILLIINFIPDIPKFIYYFIVSSVFTLLICIVLGSNKVNNIIQTSVNKIIDIVKDKKSILKKTSIFILIIFVLCIPIMTEIINNKKNHNIIYDKLSLEEQERLDDSVSILFTGDLILLKNQIERAYDPITNKYDFSPMFQYAKKYITDADFSIGVLEGVMAGESSGYTNTSLDNMDDDIFVNYPDDFGYAIKDAGFDLVTLSTNHLLDKGKAGAYRTTDILNEIGLDYTGIYKNVRNNSKIVEIKGVKIGILSYTYNLAYHSDDDALKENITPMLVSKISKNFSKVKKDVENDFKKLKEQHPNIIIVLPHMGTQFTSEVDYFQETWNEIFIENGANIILGDHSHHVQPIEYKKNKKGEDVIIVNSPGNFVNSFTRFNGDATAMVEVYINKDDYKVMGCSVIPMWTYSPLEGNYKALPINDIMKNDELRNNLTVYDLERVKNVYSLITKVMLKTELPISNIEEKLYYSKDGYKRGKVLPLELSDAERNSQIYQLINNANVVMFIGDSITAGSLNGGYAWYEPLMSNFKNKKVINVAQGSATIKTISKQYKKQTADLYIFAIGTNDIRYRNNKICAMNENDFINSINNFIDMIPNKEDAQFVFVAPWLSTDEDNVMTNIELKNDLNRKYYQKLEEFCLENDYLYINPNDILKKVYDNESSSKYLLDYIHPNSSRGIYLYSKSVIEASIK